MIGLYQNKRQFHFRWSICSRGRNQTWSLTDAIGSGQKAAYYADAYVMNKEVEAFPEKQQVNKDTLAKAYFDKMSSLQSWRTSR